MKNITIQAYEYNELNGQAKEKAYNKMYDFMIDFIKSAYQYLEKQEDIIFANGEKAFDISDDDIQDYCNENEIVFDARGRII